MYRESVDEGLDEGLLAVAGGVLEVANQMVEHSLFELAIDERRPKEKRSLR